MILFVTDDSGNVVDFRIGLDGDITPRDPNFTGLSVYDRDAAGVILQTSNATGSTGFDPCDPSMSSGPGATGTTGFKAPDVPAQYARSDGFAMANGIEINTVRAFDSNLGAWTTPDAFRRRHPRPGLAAKVHVEPRPGLTWRLSFDWQQRGIGGSGGAGARGAPKKES